eukprot:TRINITY_DN1706_c0_g1_i2.p1 TRINITY_DN1706_c0_g1~~TRINITY_DN1706_c0_g1_i2.p1  ORF type:complete len:121 (+),score=15.58 TRINITY_DN1706_c0_g1_i2:47-364(+)
MLRAARPCLGGQGQLRGLCSAAKDKSRRKVDWKPSDAYRSSATVSARAAKRLEVGLEAEAAAPAGIRYGSADVADIVAMFKPYLIRAQCIDSILSMSQLQASLSA